MLEVNASWQRGKLNLDVAIAIEAKGVTALFGRSGCGKTSLLRLIAGLEKAPGAEVRFNGTPWQQGRHFVPLHQRRLGLVFQESSLFAHLSVKDNLLFGYKRTDKAQRRIQPGEVIEMLALAPLLEQGATQLSGGQRQRVALGRALLTSPQLLLLDEPLAALDSQSKADILPYLAKVNRELGIPMILVSHNVDEVARLADNVAFMAGGGVSNIEPISQALMRAESPLLAHSEQVLSYDGPAAILQGQLQGADEMGRYPFGAPDVRLWLLPSKRWAGLEGQTLRIRVLARDVALASAPPGLLSIQNQLPAVVDDIAAFGQQWLITLRLADGQLLLSEIGTSALKALDITQGKRVIALIKSSALLDS
ncbi:molybdenum ABC transporter ATP-binding protein [Gallaecimonas mangrovi]|uniref:molybdenum ABC transporter ATP-binding protein n=1 Tax=Gallaecimonas mangrovi TaxID=2291597 RepID=UPI000E20593A|nr:molybdenum ABC transporter ATP-binding protein [Gallaecimonas mangrovi]